MRTTVTIDPDVEALLQRVMKLKNLSFKEALNSAVRLGLSRGQASKRKATPLLTFEMRQRADLNLDKALRLSEELEDEESARKLSVGR